jgi:hypothetical protein
MLELWSFIVEVLILAAVCAESWLTWKGLQHKNKESIKRSVRGLLRGLRIKVKR